MSFLHFSRGISRLRTAERVGVPCTSKTRPSSFTREIRTALRSLKENFHNCFTYLLPDVEREPPGGDCNFWQVPRVYDRNTSVREPATGQQEDFGLCSWPAGLAPEPAIRTALCNGVGGSQIRLMQSNGTLREKHTPIIYAQVLCLRQCAKTNETV